MRLIESLIVVMCVALVVPNQAAAKSNTDIQINWSTYNEAHKAANGTRKYFVYFYTDQCGYCKLLEANAFKDETVVGYINANFTPVRVNAGKELKLASRFGVQGVPDLRFLSPEGEGIARWPGYIESVRLLAMLRYIHTDSYTKMNFSDFVREQKRKEE